MRLHPSRQKKIKGASNCIPQLKSRTGAAPEFTLYMMELLCFREHGDLSSFRLDLHHQRVDCLMEHRERQLV